MFDAARLTASVSELIRVEHEQGQHRVLIDTTDLEFAPSVSRGDLFDIPDEQYVVEGADREDRASGVEFLTSH